MFFHYLLFLRLYFQLNFILNSQPFKLIFSQFFFLNLTMVNVLPTVKSELIPVYFAKNLTLCKTVLMYLFHYNTFSLISILCV